MSDSSGGEQWRISGFAGNLWDRILAPALRCHWIRKGQEHHIGFEFPARCGFGMNRKKHPNGSNLLRLGIMMIDWGVQPAAVMPPMNYGPFGEPEP